ncbi:hypothetical protein M8J75_004839 [Diaphorina citri]|nr:hypothetical protein M8J75_004839 [Diaphorina citri]
MDKINPMSTWILSTNTCTQVINLCQSLEKNAATNPDNEDFETIRQFWKANFNKNSASVASEKHQNTTDYFVPHMDGIWKQSYVLDLVDDDSDEESEDNDEDLKPESQPLHTTQEDSFLAELSQMFK